MDGDERFVSISALLTEIERDRKIGIPIGQDPKITEELIEAFEEAYRYNPFKKGRWLKEPDFPWRLKRPRRFGKPY